MLRASLLVVAAIGIGILSANLPAEVGTLLALASILGLLVGVLWLTIAYLDRSDLLHVEDMKFSLRLVRDYLKGLVVRDRL